MRWADDLKQTAAGFDGCQSPRIDKPKKNRGLVLKQDATVVAYQ